MGQAKLHMVEDGAKAGRSEKTNGQKLKCMNYQEPNVTIV